MRLLGQQVAVRHLRRQITDPRLREKLTPDYTMGCKRVLISEDYYPALARRNVDVLTDGVAEVRENSVVATDGTEYEVDAIIFGTGFHVTDAFDDLHVVGRGGTKLAEAWQDGITAYLGTTVTGFPNMFLLLGPNTGLGHNSVVFMIEAQVNYIMQYLRLLSRQRATAADLRPHRQAAFNEKIQARLAGTVWNAGGCTSWYLDPNGKNTTVWPGFTWRFWLRTRRAHRSDYELIR